MNSKERVFAALNGDPHDRPPYALQQVWLQLNSWI